MNRFLTAKLREYALRLRSMADKGAAPADLAEAKGDMMGEVFKVCVACCVGDRDRTEINKPSQAKSSRVFICSSIIVEKCIWI